MQGNLANSSILAFANPLAQTYAGQISGSGSLTKTAAGTLTLTGASTFSGGTTISGGWLLVNGSLASPVTVNTGGGLGGAG